MTQPFQNDLVYICKRNHTSLDGLGRRDRENREREQAFCELVENVRIVSVCKPNDALTLDVELVQNIDYFKKIMKLVDGDFLKRELKLTKET